MKAAIVSPETNVSIVDSRIPTPAPDEVLIKVVVSGSNPKDWKYPETTKLAHNSGDDIAGTVESAGKLAAHSFARGQRVAALHVLGAPHGSFAEYAVAPAHCVFAIPEGTSFEEAATVPLAAMTAAVGLFARLSLPTPWEAGAVDGKRQAPVGPFIIYGAASAVGAFAIQLAKRAGVGPLACVAGKGIPFVEGLLDPTAGDVVLDYRKGNDALVAGLKKAAGGRPYHYAFNCVGNLDSFTNLARVIAPEGSKLTSVLPGWESAGMPPQVETSITLVKDVGEDQTDFGQAWFALFSKGLRDGWLKGHPYQVVPNGLAGVEQGLRDLKAGKASATKYIFRLADTPGL